MTTLKLELEHFSNNEQKKVFLAIKKIYKVEEQDRTDEYEGIEDEDIEINPNIFGRLTTPQKYEFFKNSYNQKGETLGKLIFKDKEEGGTFTCDFWDFMKIYSYFFHDDGSNGANNPPPTIFFKNENNNTYLNSKVKIIDIPETTEDYYYTAAAPKNQSFVLRVEIEILPIGGGKRKMSKRKSKMSKRKTRRTRTRKTRNKFKLY